MLVYCVEFVSMSGVMVTCMFTVMILIKNVDEILHPGGVGTLGSSGEDGRYESSVIL